MSEADKARDQLLLILSKMVWHEDCDPSRNQSEENDLKEKRAAFRDALGKERCEVALGKNECGPLKVGEEDEAKPVSPIWPLFHHRPDEPGNTDWPAGVYIDIRPDESKEEALARAERIAQILSCHAWK